MVIVRMNDRVQVEHEVTTIARLAEEGRIEFRAVTTVSRKRHGERHERTAYCAFLKGTDECWEIGKLAYMSRTGAPVEFRTRTKDLP